jgi:hypothetical protein
MKMQKLDHVFEHNHGRVEIFIDLSMVLIEIQLPSTLFEAPVNLVIW